MYSPTQKKVLYGQPCQTCEGKKMMGGMVCQTCQGDGEYQIMSCPQHLVTPDVHAVLNAAEDYRMGHLPVAGGILDQAHGVMEAIRAVVREEAPYRDGEDE